MKQDHPSKLNAQETPLDYINANTSRRDFITRASLGAASLCSATTPFHTAAATTAKTLKLLPKAINSNALFTGFFTGELDDVTFDKFLASLPSLDSLSKSTYWHQFRHIVQILNCDDLIPYGFSYDKLSLTSLVFMKPRDTSIYTIDFLEEYYQETLTRVLKIESDFKATGNTNHQLFTNCKFDPGNEIDVMLNLNTFRLDYSIFRNIDSISTESYKNGLDSTIKTLQNGLKILSKAKNPNTKDWRAKIIRCLTGLESKEATENLFDDLCHLNNNSSNFSGVLQEMSRQIKNENKKIGDLLLNQDLLRGSGEFNEKTYKSFRLAQKYALRTKEFKEDLAIIDKIVDLTEGLIPEHSRDRSLASNKNANSQNLKLEINQKRSKSSKNLPISFKVTIDSLDEYTGKTYNKNQEESLILFKEDKEFLSYLIGLKSLYNPDLVEVLFYQNHIKDKYSIFYIYPVFKSDIGIIENKKSVIIPHPEGFEIKKSESIWDI